MCYFCDLNQCFCKLCLVIAGGEKEEAAAENSDVGEHEVIDADIVAEVVAEAAEEVQAVAEETSQVVDAVEEAAQELVITSVEPESTGTTSEEEAAASEAWGSAHPLQGGTHVQTQT